MRFRKRRDGVSLAQIVPVRSWSSRGPPDGSSAFGSLLVNGSDYSVSSMTLTAQRFSLDRSFVLAASSPPAIGHRRDLLDRPVRLDPHNFLFPYLLLLLALCKALRRLFAVPALLLLLQLTERLAQQTWRSSIIRLFNSRPEHSVIRSEAQLLALLESKSVRLVCELSAACALLSSQHSGRTSALHRAFDEALAANPPLKTPAAAALAADRSGKYVFLGSLGYARDHLRAATCQPHVLRLQSFGAKYYGVFGRPGVGVPRELRFLLQYQDAERHRRQALRDSCPAKVKAEHLTMEQISIVFEAYLLCVICVSSSIVAETLVRRWRPNEC